MRKDRNVSVAMNEVEYKSLLELKEVLDKRSHRIKSPNHAECIRYAISFTKDNIDSPELIDDFEKKLEDKNKEIQELKRINEIYEQALLKIENTVKLTSQVD